MSESLTPSSAEGVFEADLRGVHYDFLKNRVPDWFTQASVQRQVELANHELVLPEWYVSATPAVRAQLADRHNQYRDSLNAIEKKLGGIEDVLAFAEPLLKEALKKTFNLDLDVKKVYFARKYGFKNQDVLYGFLVFDQQEDPTISYQYRGMSLLETALANFESHEEQRDSCADCRIITQFDFGGEIIPTLYAVNSQALSIAPHEFARLCRTLDLGARYQAHIKALVEPDDKGEREALEQQLEEHQRQLLALSADVSKGGISISARQMLQKVLAGQSDVELDGKPVTFAALKLFGSTLVGPLLIGANRRDSRRVERLLVYIPNDPRQPLKEYASAGDFMVDLRARLHSASYRRFFSRFIPAQVQGLVFRQFNALYKPANGDAASDFPIRQEAPKLPLDEARIVGSLWLQMREAQVRKIFADARAVAVPTGDEDRKERLERLEGFVDAVNSVFNLAAFVVPGLGPIMLAVGAAQMFSDVFEGFEAYEQGDVKTMWAHFSSVALNAAFFAAGAKVLPQVQISSAVDSLKPVTLATGKQVLWKPDIEPYKQDVELPAGSQPDEHGLHLHDDRQVLSLEGRHLVVTPDPATDVYRIEHPDRAHAYQPGLRHNGDGAWLHEVDQPRTWEGAVLMRRLGHPFESFDDTRLEQIRQVSEVSPEQLRRVHTESEPTPPVLLETAQRFRAYDDALKVSQQIREGSLSDRLSESAVVLMLELRGWPADIGIVVIRARGSDATSRIYWPAGRVGARLITISAADLMAGRLPERVVTNFNNEQLRGLLGQHLPPERIARADVLKDRLVDHAQNAHVRLFNSLSKDPRVPVDPAGEMIQRDFPRLSNRMAGEVLGDAAPDELSAINTRQRIPLRLTQRAREQQAEMRLTQARESLHLTALSSPDTEVLVLSTLERLPGWPGGLRLEVRADGVSGNLRASIGPADEAAASRKVLAHIGDGQYQAYDHEGNQLHGVDSLYNSLQHALPDSHRVAIGLPHVGQGAELQVQIINHALPRESLRQVLGMQPLRRPFFRAPQRWPDGRLGYPLSMRAGGNRMRSMLERLRVLFPDVNDAALNQLLEERRNMDDQWLTLKEAEYRDLDNTLQKWLTDGPRGRDPQRTRRRIYEAIRNAWRGCGKADFDDAGNYRGQKIILKGSDVSAHLEKLPVLPAAFDHVTNLKLESTGLTDNGARFLSNFRRLRVLDLGSNNLTRLPEAISRMSHLQELWMAENRLVLTSEAVQQLKGLRRMVLLTLEGNPLGMAPDISLMGDLVAVQLAGTGLTRWPTGLFARPRPRSFVLDMTSNRMTEIPEVAPGSDRASMLARTFVTREYLSGDVLERLKLYIESIGLDPERSIPPRGILDSTHWKAGLPYSLWLEKQTVWDAVEEDFGSEPFFNELRKLQESADVDDPEFREDLTSKVWRMLDAMAEDTDLRKKLFEMATAPTTCVDAGAQLFNAMGVEVMLYQARAIPDAGLRKLELLGLAKGKSRIDQLGAIARARVTELLGQGRRFPEYDQQGDLITQYDVLGNVVPAIDEVEIHLKYVTELALRLDLPWQSRSMRFQEPDVTPLMIEDAYQRVIALEQGDLLRDNIIQQPFWSEYMEDVHRDRFEALRAKFETLTDLFDDLQTLADGNNRTAQEQQALRDRIEASATALGKSPGEISPDRPMTDDEYFAEAGRLEEEKKSLLRTLTDQEMGRVPTTTASVQ